MNDILLDLSGVSEFVSIGMDASVLDAIQVLLTISLWMLILFAGDDRAVYSQSCCHEQEPCSKTCNSICTR